MSVIKHTQEFKRSVVERYLTGDVSKQGLAKQLNLSSFLVRQWVTLYQEHGDDGLIRKQINYDPDVKFAILQKMWNNSLTPARTALLCNVRNSKTIVFWERHYLRDGMAGLQRNKKGSVLTLIDPTPKTPAIPPDDDNSSREELLAQVKWLRMENAYLKKLKALVQAQQHSAVLKKRS